MTDFEMFIGSNDWSIKFVDGIIIEEKDCKNKFEIEEVDDYEPPTDVTTYGICDNDNKIIAVATYNIDNEDIATTFLHELIHAVAKEHHIDIPEEVVEDMGIIMMEAYHKIKELI